MYVFNLNSLITLESSVFLNSESLSKLLHVQAENIRKLLLKQNSINQLNLVIAPLQDIYSRGATGPAMAEKSRTMQLTQSIDFD